MPRRRSGYTTLPKPRTVAPAGAGNPAMRQPWAMGPPGKAHTMPDAALAVEGPVWRVVQFPGVDRRLAALAVTIILQGADDPPVTLVKFQPSV